MTHSEPIGDIAADSFSDDSFDTWANPGQENKKSPDSPVLPIELDPEIEDLFESEDTVTPTKEQILDMQLNND